MSRISKQMYYLNIAKSVAMRSTCLRRHYGAVIVKNDEIISTGYNGSPRGCDNCTDINKCIRNELNIPGKERYELCKSVHAEMNAIISASRSDMIGSTLYLVGLNPDGTIHNSECCDMCKKLIINAGIKEIVIQKFDSHVTPSYWTYYANDSEHSKAPFMNFIDDINEMGI